MSYDFQVDVFAAACAIFYMDTGVPLMAYSCDGPKNRIPRDEYARVLQEGRCQNLKSNEIPSDACRVRLEDRISTFNSRFPNLIKKMIKADRKERITAEAALAEMKYFYQEGTIGNIKCLYFWNVTEANL